MAVTENPLMAGPMALAIPADYALRKLGVVEGRSRPSLQYITEGYGGVLDGLFNAYNRMSRKVVRQPKRQP